MSNEYRTAYELHNAACRVFTAAQNDYRSGKIGDSEYLAARKAFDAATMLFDVAYAAEEVRVEAEVEAAAEDFQLALF